MKRRSFIKLFAGLCALPLFGRVDTKAKCEIEKTGHMKIDDEILSPRININIGDPLIKGDEMRELIEKINREMVENMRIRILWRNHSRPAVL